jgi:hypothetical protein
VGAGALGALGLGGAAAYGGKRYIDHKVDPILKDTRGLIQQGTDTLQNIQQRVNPILDNAEQITNMGQNLLQTKNDAYRPWLNMSNHFGSGLAGLLGVQGYNQPQWQQSLMAFLRNLFSGQWLSGRTATASYSNPRSEKMTTTPTMFQSLQTAIFGSEQFQKLAGAGSDIPDTKTFAHKLISKEMKKVASVLEESGATVFAGMLKKASKKVKKGCPAKVAMLAQVNNDAKLASQAESVLTAIAGDILSKKIVQTFEEKKAAFLATKQAAATA